MNRYHIYDTEARDALQLVNTPKYSLEGLVELGPANEDFMGPVNKLPVELKAMVLIEKFLPGPRVIRAVYSSDIKMYTYRCTSPANKIPYVSYGLKKLMAPLANTIFKAAPSTGVDAYPFFNPELDTISFEYLDCITGTEGSKLYNEAVLSAGDILRHHAKSPHSAPVRKIQITWCHNESITSEVLNSFRDIPNLEKVVLLAHDHFTEAHCDQLEMSRDNFDPEYKDEAFCDPYEILRYHAEYLFNREYEARHMRALVRTGALDGSYWGVDKSFQPYPFKVELVDHNGEEVLYWEDEDYFHAAN